MKAAVVTGWGKVPVWREVDDAVAGERETVVDVLAAALHPRVRSQADGSHYTSTEQLPIVPGIDGVGRDHDGALRYFVLPGTALGSMAQRTVIDVRRSVVLPSDADPVTVAAAMNPAMSSWIALRHRASIARGDTVLILGATGSAGSLAVQVAKKLGAQNVIAVGRDRQRLAALSSHARTLTYDELSSVADDVDIVLDYVWGEPTAQAMTTLITHRRNNAAPLTWIEVGSVAGPTAPIPSAALRAANLRIVGSGQGSVSTRDIVADLPKLADLILADSLRMDVRIEAMADVERVWTRTSGQRERIVFTP